MRFYPTISVPLFSDRDISRKAKKIHKRKYNSMKKVNSIRNNTGFKTRKYNVNSVPVKEEYIEKIIPVISVTITIRPRITNVDWIKEKPVSITDKQENLQDMVAELEKGQVIKTSDSVSTYDLQSWGLCWKAKSQESHNYWKGVCDNIDLYKAYLKKLDKYFDIDDPKPQEINYEDEEVEEENEYEDLQCLYDATHNLKDVINTYNTKRRTK